jgi:hypothetical protein
VTAFKIKTYDLQPQFVESLAQTFFAMGLSYSTTKPMWNSPDSRDQHMLIVETKNPMQEADVRGYLNLMSVNYETFKDGRKEEDVKALADGKYAMITVKQLTKIGVGFVIEQLREFGINHRVIEGLGGLTFMIDVFCDTREDVVKVGLFCSRTGLEMEITYTQKADAARVQEVIDSEDLPSTPEEQSWHPKSHYVELNPIQAFYLQRGWSAEEARKRHSKEEWFSQTDRDISNRELWRGKAIEKGVPEAQADRFIYSGPQPELGV